MSEGAFCGRSESGDDLFNALFESDDYGKLSERAANQEFNNVHSSEVSEH